MIGPHGRDIEIHMCQRSGQILLFHTKPLLDRVPPSSRYVGYGRVALNAKWPTADDELWSDGTLTRVPRITGGQISLPLVQLFPKSHRAHAQHHRSVNEH